jgi:glycosyltransferase involved in cell wall biosynthesis
VGKSVNGDEVMTVLKFRKKPVVVEAVQYDGSNKNEIIQFTNGKATTNCMKINCIGQVEGASGFACHTRELSLALSRLGMDVSIETGMQDPNWQRAVPEELRKLILKDHRTDGIQLMITQPNFAYLKSGDNTKILQYCIFEGTKIPTGMALALKENFVTRVIVPSNHTLNACSAAGVPRDKIDIVPHGYDPKIFNTTGRIESDVFSFVWCKGWALGENDRSNLTLFLRAFAEEFKDEAKVKAVVKINPTYARIDYPAAIRALNLKGMKDKLFLNAEIIPAEQLAQMYRAGNVFVSTSRGESFNLPVLEAMACGLPAIAPWFGGHADFVDDFKNGFILKKGRYIEPGDANPMYEETSWWEADQKELQEKMRYCFDNQDEIKKMGNLAAFDACAYTWEETAKKIKAICESI